MSVTSPSPGFMSNCASAIRFHFVAACTTSASTGCCPWSFAMWNAHGRARAVAVEVVVDAARGVDDQRHLDADQVQLAAEAVLDVPLHGRERALRLVRGQQRRVVVRQDLLELGVVADPRACEIRRLVDGCHGALQSLDGTPSTLLRRAGPGIRRGRQTASGEPRRPRRARDQSISVRR